MPPTPCATPTPRTAKLGSRTSPAPLHGSRIAEKSYHGRQGRYGVEVWVEEFRPWVRCRREATTLRPLPLHLEVRNHSPTGFAWGYGGSGLAQLALALLIDATGDENLALRHYHRLKQQHITGWKQEWSMTAHQIRAFVAAQEQLGCNDHTPDTAF